jgi:hypothetical protein
VPAAAKGPVARTGGPTGRFAAELGGMCAVMCLGGTVATFAAFTAAGWLGYPGLARQAPGLSALIIAVCLAVPVAVYMAVRGHGRRHNLVMTGTTIGVGLVMAALLWAGVIPTAGLQTWHSLFMLVCGPACLLMIAEMLISSGTYSGRARHHAPWAEAARRPAAAATAPYPKRGPGKQVRTMTKRAIIKWWIWGLIAFVPGAILIPSSALALATHHQGVNDAYGRTMVALIAAGGLFALAAVAAGLVGWVAAVLNTRRLADPRWFQALLWGGIAGILTTPLAGLGALVLASVMMAYLVAGPDGLAAEPRLTTPAKAAITRWAGWGFATAGAGTALALLVANLTYPGRLLHGVGWPSLALVSLGITVIAAGAVVVWAAWWAAIFNTHLLSGKTWFNALLWSGIPAAVTMPLFGFGALILAGVLIAYWRAAPDGLAAQRPQPATAAPLPTSAQPPPAAHQPGQRPAA